MKYQLSLLLRSGGATTPHLSLFRYTATKQALDDILTYYSAVEGLGWTRLILGDTYGVGDTRGKLLSLLLDAAVTGKSVEAASGHQLWEALNVNDVVVALLDAAEEQLHARGRGRTNYVRRRRRPFERCDDRGISNQRAIPVRWGARPDRGREMLTPGLSQIPRSGGARESTSGKASGRFGSRTSPPAHDTSRGYCPRSRLSRMRYRGLGTRTPRGDRRSLALGGTSRSSPLPADRSRNLPTRNPCHKRGWAPSSGHEKSTRIVAVPGSPS